MRNFRIFVLAVASVMSIASCTHAGIKGGVIGLDDGDRLVLKELRGSERTVVDTIAVGKGGRFSYRLNMEKTDRNFFFLYYGERKLASLILSPGEKVELACDTTGSWTVSGSEECESLRLNEVALAAVSRVNPLMMKDFVAHYRKMLSFVMTHSHSLTVVPVLFQKIRDIPLFGQPSDGVIMAGIADSLEMSYPTSPYVGMLRNASREKISVMNLQSMLERANSVDYPQIELADINGEIRKLCDNVGTKTLIAFWDASDTRNKLFNQDVLLPAYEQYSNKGLTIFQVGLLSDKAAWAMAVRQQHLPWTSVFDANGSTIQLYRISRLPSIFILENGNLRKIENPDRKSVFDALK